MTKKKTTPAASQPVTEKKQPGRPVGAGNVVDVVTVAPSRCRKCQSTDRTPYTNTVERAIEGLQDGQPYTHILWRATKCAACGQSRRDRCFENRQGK